MLQNPNLQIFTSFADEIAFAIDFRNYRTPYYHHKFPNVSSALIQTVENFPHNFHAQFSTPQSLTSRRQERVEKFSSETFMTSNHILIKLLHRKRSVTEKGCRRQGMSSIGVGWKEEKLLNNPEWSKIVITPSQTEAPSLGAQQTRRSGLLLTVERLSKQSGFYVNERDEIRLHRRALHLVNNPRKPTPCHCLHIVSCFRVASKYFPHDNTTQKRSWRCVRKLVDKHVPVNFLILLWGMEIVVQSSVEIV